MTASNSIDAAPICCLSLRQNMNLRKTRSSSGQKRNSSCKGTKPSVRKGRKSPIYTEDSENSSKSLPKTSAKHQKITLDSLMIKTSNMNPVTSTPISLEARGRISRSSVKRISNELSKLNSFDRIHYPITSTPIQKTLIQTKACAVMLSPLKFTRKKNSNKSKSAQTLRSNKRSFNSKLSHFSQNSPVGALRKNKKSMRNSIVLRSQDASNKTLNDIKTPLSQISKYPRKISIKHLSSSEKSKERVVIPQNKVCKNIKNIRKSSICAEKLAFPISSTSKDKSNEISISRKTLDKDVSQTSNISLPQSYHETDNSKSSRYSLRNSTAPKKESYSKIKMNDMKNSPLSSTSKNLNSASDKLHAMTRKKKNALDIEVSKHSQISLSDSNNKTETSKPLRKSLRLQNQHSSKTADAIVLSSKSSLILNSQDIRKTAKDLLDSCSKNTKRSSRYISSKGRQSSKKTAIKKSSRSSEALQSQPAVKKNSTKKQELAKKFQHQNKTSKPYRKSPGSSKRQLSFQKSHEFQQKYFTFTGDIPIDDLALSKRTVVKRKVKSDGFKLSGKNTLKRKRCAIDAIIKADEDYEDDIYEDKNFDKFKDLIMDASDSERSFSISTPKFPCTPLVRQKTPKFKDCFSPTEYAASRKIAMEYIYRNRKRSQQKPETPVIVEKKKLEFSQVLEEAQKLKETVENLAEGESDDDSYFSFC